jgi:hypothetical protein
MFHQLMNVRIKTSVNGKNELSRFIDGLIKRNAQRTVAMRGLYVRVRVRVRVTVRVRVRVRVHVRVRVRVRVRVLVRVRVRVRVRFRVRVRVLPKCETIGNEGRNNLNEKERNVR